MNKKTTKQTPLANPEFSKAMQGLRMSSAADRHQDSRTQRARTRQASKRRSFADWA